MRQAFVYGWYYGVIDLAKGMSMTNINEVVAQVNEGDAYAQSALTATVAVRDSAKEIMAVEDDHPAVAKVREAVSALFTELRRKSDVAVEGSLGAECDNARTVYDIALDESYPVVGISYQALQSAEKTVEHAVTASEKIELIELQVLGALGLGLQAVREQGRHIYASAESTQGHIVRTLAASEEAVRHLLGGSQH